MSYKEKLKESDLLILAEVVYTAIKTGIIYGILVRMDITDEAFEDAVESIGLLKVHPELQKLIEYNRAMRNQLED